MPLTADEFDASSQYPVRLLEFLWATPNTAFTFSELSDQFRDSDFTLDNLDYALRVLVETRRLERRYFDEKVYYLYRET